MKIKGTWLDFYILLLIFSVVAGGLAAGHRLLFGHEDYIGSLIIETEELDGLYGSYLKVGDIIYDTRTKRRIGTIAAITEHTSEDGIAFTLKIDAERLPSGAALRTKRLWFRYRDAQPDSSDLSAGAESNASASGAVIFRGKAENGSGRGCREPSQR